jgi:hypothetical protein
MNTTALTCPWCEAPRATGPVCPKCGADYAKAAQIRQSGRAEVVAAPLVIEPVEAVAEEATADIEDPGREFWLRVIALPAFLAAGIVFHVAAPFLQRTFLTMPLHELGHALSAWLCGYAAMPTLWFTWVAESRGWLTPLLLAGAIAAIGYRAWLARCHACAALGALLLVLQAVGTLAIDERTAQMLFTFGGDGVGMVLATALMATFFFGTRTQLYRGGLRWGFLAIGAGAFVDIFSVWWVARNDYSDIPLGEMEGRGPSDASKLVDWYGWTLDQLASRYSTLGVCCLLALAAVWAWGVLQAARAQAGR